MAATLEATYILLDRATPTLRKMRTEAAKTQVFLRALGEDIDKIGSSKQLGQLNKVGQTLGSIGKSADKNEKSVGRMRRTWDRFNDRLPRLARGLTSVTKGLATVGAGLKGMLTALPVLVTLAIAAAPAILALAGAVGALAVSLGAAVGGGLVLGGGLLGSLAVGLGGIAAIAIPATGAIKEMTTAQDALNKAIESGDPSKIKEAEKAIDALEKKAPGVTKVANAMDGLGNTWKGLTKAGQTDFFGIVTSGIHTVKKLMPTFASQANKNMSTVRDAFENIIKPGLESGGFKAFFVRLNRIFRVNVPGLAQGFRDLGEAFAEIIKVASPTLKDFGGGFAKAMASFNKAVHSPAGHKFINNMIEAFKSWSKLIWSVIRLFGKLIGAMGQKGKDDGTTLVQGWTDAINSFTDGLSNGEIATFFDKMIDDSRTIWKIFAGIATAAWNITNALRPAVMAVAKIAGAKIPGTGVNGAMAAGGAALLYKGFRASLGTAANPMWVRMRGPGSIPLPGGKKPPKVPGEAGEVAEDLSHASRAGRIARGLGKAFFPADFAGRLLSGQNVKDSAYGTVDDGFGGFLPGGSHSLVTDAREGADGVGKALLQPRIFDQIGDIQGFQALPSPAQGRFQGQLAGATVDGDLKKYLATLVGGTSSHLTPGHGSALGSLGVPSPAAMARQAVGGGTGPLIPSLKGPVQDLEKVKGSLKDLNSNKSFKIPSLKDGLKNLADGWLKGANRSKTGREDINNVLKGVSQDFTDKTEEMKTTTAQGFGDIFTEMTAAIGKIAGEGAGAIGTSAASGARSVNKGAQSKRAPASAKARGGRIEGKGLHDTVPIGGNTIAAPGEMIVNRHTENRLDGMLGAFGTSLDREVSSESRPHYMAKGGRSAKALGRAAAGGAVPTALVPGHPELHPGISAATEAILKKFPSMVISSTTGGTHASGSYHYLGEAADIYADSATMEQASEWIKSSGLSRSLTEGIHNPNLSISSGAEVPSSFYADVWAGHTDHIHLAVAGALQAIVAGAAGGAIGAVKAPKLKRPIAKGKGLYKDASQGAMDKMLAVAQKKVNKAAGAPGAIGGAVGKGIQQYNHSYPSGGGAVLSPEAVQAIASSAGLPGVAFEQIAHGESAYRPAAVSTDPGGTHGYGLWQITSGFNDDLIAKYGGVTGMFNPIQNAKAAKEIYDRQGIGAWYGTQFLTAFDKGGRVPWYGNGADFIADRPQVIGVGDGGPERVTVEPLSGGKGGASKRPIQLHIGKIENHRAGDVRRHVRKEIAQALDDLSDKVELLPMEDDRG